MIKNKKRVNRKPVISVVLGTGRKGRMSERVFKCISKELSKRLDIEAIFVDVLDYTFGFTIPSWENDLRTNKWKEIVKKSDGILIIVPEYNHSYPGEFKLLLDSVFSEYRGKPVVLCGVSSGKFGGARAVEALRAPLSYLGMIIMPTNLFASSVQNSFGEKGESKDSEFVSNLKKAIDELISYAGFGN